MRCADDKDIAERRIRIELLVAQNRAFDFLGAHAVARHVDDIVGTAVQRETFIGMAHGEIALGIGPDTLPAPPVAAVPAVTIAGPARGDAAVLDMKMFRITPDGARQIRIGCGDDDLALFAEFGAAPLHAVTACTFQRCGCGGSALLILHPDIAEDPRQREGARIGRQREIAIAIEMRPGDAAMLGGPIAVDILRRQMLHAEGLHRRRTWLGAEGRDPQPAHVIGLDVVQVLRIGHHRLEEGDTGLEDGHAMAFDHRGKAPGVRENRRAFAEQRRHPGQQRCRDHVALPGDPARIGDDIQNVAGPRIERHLHGFGDAGGITAMDMDNTLGLACRPRGIDEEHRIIGIDRCDRRGCPDSADKVLIGQALERGKIGKAGRRQQRCQRGIGQFMAPDIAVAPDDVGLGGMARDDHGLHARRCRHQAFGHGDPDARRSR